MTKAQRKAHKIGNQIRAIQAHGWGGRIQQGKFSAWANRVIERNKLFSLKP